MARWSIFNNKPAPPVTVRVHCDRCSYVTVDQTDITLRLCIDTHDACYRFKCPDCRRIQIVDIVLESVVSRMLELGWVPECWYLPSELWEPHDHPPITMDDLREAWLELDAL